MTVTVPDIRVSQPEAQPVTEGDRRAKSSPVEISAIRRFLLSRGNSAVADRVFHLLMVLCGLSIFGIVALIAYELLSRSQMSWHAFGLGFFYRV